MALGPIIEKPLADLDEWEAFATANRDALVDAYGSIDKALQHACDGGLELGGGAAPTVVVYFTDADPEHENI